MRALVCSTDVFYRISHKWHKSDSSLEKELPWCELCCPHTAGTCGLCRVKDAWEEKRSWDQGRGQQRSVAKRPWLCGMKGVGWAVSRAGGEPRKISPDFSGDQRETTQFLFLSECREFTLSRAWSLAFVIVKWCLLSFIAPP